jgi:hydroxymethylbilane synthase
MIPQVGQGSLAVECRADDDDTRELLRAVEHGPSRILLDAERDFLVELGGDCNLPAGAFAELGPGSSLTVTGVLAPLSGSPLARRSLTDDIASRPGTRLAVELRGAVPVDPPEER